MLYRKTMNLGIRSAGVLRWTFTACVLVTIASVATPARGGDADVAALVEQLRSDDASVRVEAASRLVTLGEAAVPALMDALGDANLSLRIQATDVLARLGPKAAAATDALIENLMDDGQGLVFASVRALGRVRSERARMALWSLLRDNERAWIRTAAIVALVAAEPKGLGFDALRLEMRRGRGARMRVFAALRALERDAVPVFVALIRDPSWHIRLWSVRAGPPIVGQPRVWLDALAAAANDASSAVALAATTRLALAKDACVVAPLVRLLPAAHLDVRREAAFGLAQHGPLDEKATSALLAALAEPDTHLRRNVAAALQGAPDLALVKPALRPLLSETSHGVWIAAARTLAHLGDRGPDLMPPLIEAVRMFGGIPAPFAIHRSGSRDLGFGGGHVRFQDVAAQVSIDDAPKWILKMSAERASLLERAALDLKAPRHLAFAFVLGHLGAPAAKSLGRLMKSADLGVRMSAACSLARLGEAGKAAVPALLPLARKRAPEDLLVVRAGETIPDAEIEEEGEDGAWPGTTWILESREALVAIGPAALPAVEAVAREDAAVASRLAPVLLALRKKRRARGTK